MRVHGLLLAAGAGRRMGRPKALVRGGDGVPWLLRSVGALREGGCAEVTVVLGAAADEAAALVPGERVVLAPDWAEGMGASLRAGLRALEGGDPACEAALVLLVDLPDVSAAVVARVLAERGGSGVLARAAYDGRPGHPVLLGRDHWAEVARTARGDRGARDHLARHQETGGPGGDTGGDTRGDTGGETGGDTEGGSGVGVRLVECGDLASGVDVDAPPGDG